MATTKKDEATEELIKNTAKRLFFGEGKFNATTQEIADAAGVNRTLSTIILDLETNYST